MFSIYLLSSLSYFECATRVTKDVFHILSSLSHSHPHPPGWGLWIEKSPKGVNPQLQGHACICGHTTPSNMTGRRQDIGCHTSELSSWLWITTLVIGLDSPMRHSFIVCARPQLEKSADARWNLVDLWGTCTSTSETQYMYPYYTRRNKDAHGPNNLLIT